MPDGPSYLWAQAQWANSVCLLLFFKGILSIIAILWNLLAIMGVCKRFRDFFFLWRVIKRIKVVAVTSSVSTIRRLISAEAMKTISASAELRRNQYDQHEDFHALGAHNCSGYWIETRSGRNSPNGNYRWCGPDPKKFISGKKWNKSLLPLVVKSQTVLFVFLL